MPFSIIVPLVTQIHLSKHSLLDFFNFSLPILVLVLIGIVAVLVLFAIFSSPIGSRKNKAKRNTIFK